jgi:type IV pilus assembly protein PilA
MRQTINRMQQRGQEDRGFTMIELLVVVVIIGVLVAIAVPVYLNYRKGAANKSAASDVRGAITAVEQYYTENNNTYPDNNASTGIGVNVDLKTGATTKGVITVSPGNRVSFTNDPGTSTSYHICGVNDDGGQVYIYDSSTGGSVAKYTGASFDTCRAAKAAPPAGP